MVYFSHCGARQFPGSFNRWNTPPSRRVNLESRLAGRGPVAGRGARQSGANWSEEARGNFRECPHSRVPLSCIRRPRGPVAPPAGGSAAYTAVSLGGWWAEGGGGGRGWTESRVVRMRVREGLETKILFPGSAPGSLTSSRSVPTPRGWRLKEHPGKGHCSPQAAYSETPKI